MLGDMRALTMIDIRETMPTRRITFPAAELSQLALSRRRRAER